MNPTWDELIEIAKDKYGLVKYIEVFEPDYPFSGRCNYETGTITFNTYANLSFDRKAQLLFHELGHIHCYKNGIWKKYHFSRSKHLTKEESLAVIKIGLKAERWIDKWAQKRMLEYFGKSLEGGYESKKAAQSYSKNYLSFFRKWK